MVNSGACAHCGTTLEGKPKGQKTCSRSCSAKQRSIAGRGRFNGRSKVGKRADLGGRFFRSAWEANYARVLEHLKATGKIHDWEYEPQVFHFPVKRGNKAYLPDFRVWVNATEYEWHEIKGYMDTPSRIKLKRFALHHPAESLRLTVIDRERYKQLTKEYGELLSGWES